MQDLNRPDARPAQDRREAPLSGGGVESLDIAIMEFEQMIDRYDRDVRSYVPQPAPDRSGRGEVAATGPIGHQAVRGVLGDLQSIVLWALIIAALSTLGCTTYQPTVQMDSPQSALVSKTVIGGSKMYTVEHDGHWFVKTSDSAGGVINHPSCPRPDCNR